MKYAQTLFGIIGTFNGITALLGPTILKIFNQNYQIIYYIGCGLTFISFILVCFIKDEKFKIQNDELNHNNDDEEFNKENKDEDEFAEN